VLLKNQKRRVKKSNVGEVPVVKKIEKWHWEKKKWRGPKSNLNSQRGKIGRGEKGEKNPTHRKINWCIKGRNWEKTVEQKTKRREGSLL